MTAKDVISYWRGSAEKDLVLAQDLFHLQRYNYCLFFCHLAIEKFLKGLVYKNTHSHPLPIHNIKKLATQAKLTIPDAKEEDLDEITSWNIEARYDSIKQQFAKKATRVFTTKWFEKAKEIFLWLKNQY